MKDSKLTCTKDIETYVYAFQSGGLATITYKANMTKTEDNATLYDQTLSDYEDKAASNRNGVSASLSQLDTSFEFTVEEDLLVLSSSTLDNGYDYQTKADKIAFEMSTKGYKCN